MYMNQYGYADSRVQDYWREYRRSASRYGLAGQPGIGNRVRQVTGEALISLGSRIKPRPARSKHMAGVWQGR